MRANHHVFQHGHAPEQAHSLERYRQAKPRAMVRRQERDVLAKHSDRASIGAEVASDQVKQSRFASSVWSDHTDQLALANAERNTVDSYHTAEAPRQSFGVQDYLRSIGYWPALASSSWLTPAAGTNCPFLMVDIKLAESGMPLCFWGVNA